MILYKHFEIGHVEADFFAWNVEAGVFSGLDFADVVIVDVLFAYDLDDPSPIPIRGLQIPLILFSNEFVSGVCQSALDLTCGL